LKTSAKQKIRHIIPPLNSVGYEDDHLPEEKDIFTASTLPKTETTDSRNSYAKYMRLCRSNSSNNGFYT
jgi:hypothetical protein